MRYKLLGRSGLRVSELCLGAMTFGGAGGMGCDAAESRAIFDVFTAAGGNFIDIADMYCGGESERLVGEFIAPHRDDYVVATKFTTYLGGGVAQGGNSRKRMMTAVEQSLKRLNTDHIDLFWMHWWEERTPIDEVMRAFDDLVRQGKILYVGLSDTPAWVTAQAATLAELRGWAPVVATQFEYNLIERTAERDLIPMAKALDLAATCFYPLAAGVLTGKYLGAGPQGPSRQPHGAIPELSLQISQLVVEIAQANGITPAQCALAWLRQAPGRGVLIPIVGARTAAQMRDNLGCLSVSLPQAHFDLLEQATRPELGFPHALLALDIVKSLSTGGTHALIDDHRAW